MNKASVTHLIASLVTIIGFVYQEPLGSFIFMAGIFALSGSITNNLAIYMIFERVPFIYGSGVIINRFDDFKSGIKSLIMQEFFLKTDQSLLLELDISATDLEKKINYDHVFDQLQESIARSEMGSMLAMVGGKAALDPLKEPVIETLKTLINDYLKKTPLDPSDDDHKGIAERLERIIDQRLDVLTPDQVKIIIAKMIRKHLNWLVIWGGIFGGLMGVLCDFLLSF